jgi:hypothetical protein
MNSKKNLNITYDIMTYLVFFITKSCLYNGMASKDIDERIKKNFENIKKIKDNIEELYYVYNKIK